MRIRREEGRNHRAALGAIFGAVLLASGCGVWIWLRLGLPQPACPFRAWTGLPCPTCGSTRMAESLLRGDLLAAAAWNPLVLAVLAGTATWALASTARLALGLPDVRFELSPGQRSAVRALAALGLAAGWAWVAIRSA